MSSSRVLFVCLGNICRSPMAEAVLRQRLQATGLADAVRVDSAGTGPWHVGEPPDARAQAAAGARGYALDGFTARRVTAQDLTHFDYVIAMDHQNLAALRQLAADTPDASARIALLGDFSVRHAGEPVGDPYYGGDAGFEHVLDMIEACVDGLIERLSGSR